MCCHSDPDLPEGESLTIVAALNGIASLVPHTIDMCWAVILNGAQRNEEYISSVAGLENIPRCATIDILSSYSHYLAPYTLSILSPEARNFKHRWGAHVVLDFYYSV